MKLYYAESPLEKAQVVVVGLPFDRTSSFIPGSRLGPEYIRTCSENIEDYSPYQKKSLYDIRVCDIGDIHFETQEWQSEVLETLERIPHDKKVIVLGGEHTVTMPSVQNCLKSNKNLSIVHFDAHCDLRDEYLEERICHATVIRRVSELVGIDRVYQFGIRSGTRQEFKLNENLYTFKVYEPLKNILNDIEEPLYVTIDVDVLDPGVMPAVGTPEPGGISYRELIDSLLLLADKEIVGADIVEYSPLAASPWASGSIAAEILRELILLLVK